MSKKDPKEKESTKEITPEQDLTCQPIAQPKKKSKAKMISNIIFVVATTVLMLSLLLSFNDIQKMGEAIKKIGLNNNYLWLIAAFGITLLYFFLWPLSLTLFARASGCNTTFSDNFLIGSSEHFYNGVTPFAVGGQPFQVYTYTKRGVGTDKATATILANFVTHMIATNIIAFVSLFFWSYFTDNLASIADIDMTWFKWVAIAGYIINFLVLLFMISLGTSKTVRNIIYGAFDLLCRPKWIGKHLNKFKPTLDDYVRNAQIGFKSIFKHKKTFCFALLVRIITMLVFYSIPFFVMRALGLQLPWSYLPIVILGTSFAITAVVFFPTPGGTGGIELSLAIVIAAIGGSQALTGEPVEADMIDQQAVSLIWRMLTYYFLMFVSYICSAVMEGRISHDLKKEEEQLETANMPCINNTEIINNNIPKDEMENFEVPVNDEPKPKKIRSKKKKEKPLESEKSNEQS